MPVERIDTLVIGGGQAGLAMSYRLKQRGLAHLVLERRRIAERWRSERWDGLKFQFPNWSVRLPDFPYPHADPDGFATSGDILAYINAYADFVAPPIRCGVAVTRLRCCDGASGLVAETSDGTIEASNVVVATGPYQRPAIPALLDDGSGIFQVHASQYQNPDQLPPGAVLVVGAGASGAQIAEELLRAGRRVYLSLGAHTRLPRRYRGRDLIWWLSAIGIDQTTVEARGPSRLLPVITGAYGGHTIDFRRFAADGVTLLGRLTAADDGTIISRPISRPVSPAAMPSTPASSTSWMRMSNSTGWISPTIPRPARCCPTHAASANRCGGLTFAAVASIRSSRPRVMLLISAGSTFRSWIRAANPVMSTASPTSRAYISSACNGCRK